MARDLQLTRWQLGAALGLHAATVSLWSAHEGLAEAARVRPGGPGKPALYSARRVVAWFNRTKAAPAAGTGFRPPAWRPITLADLVVAKGPHLKGTT